MHADTRDETAPESTTVQPNVGSRRRTGALLIGVSAFVLAVAGAVFAVSVNGWGPASPDDASFAVPTVTASPAPAASPSETGELDEDAVSDVIEIALAAPITSVGTEADLRVLVENIAIDAYAAELESQWIELISQGWTVSGEPAIVSASVTELDTSGAPAKASVTACVDSSAVVISDSSGSPIGDPAAMTPRATHLFGLEQGDDGRWRISFHSFPDDPTC